jgi:hypothetical protein
MELGSSATSDLLLFVQRDPLPGVNGGVEIIIFLSMVL